MDSLLTEGEKNDIILETVANPYLWSRELVDNICEAQDLKSKRKLVEWLETPCRDDSYDKWYAGLKTVFPNRIACTQCWQQLKEGLEEP